MTKEPIRDVFRIRRLAEEGIRAKIDHAGRQIIASSPIGIHRPQLFGRKGHHTFRCASHRHSTVNFPFRLSSPAPYLPLPWKEI